MFLNTLDMIRYYYMFISAQMDVVKFLVDKCNVEVNPIDRWENTPLDDGLKYGNEKIVHYLQRKKALRGADIMNSWGGS